MDDDPEDLYTFEELEKAISLLYECLSLNKIKYVVGFSAFLNIVSHHYCEEGLSFEHFQDKMQNAIEELRCRWEKKE